MPKATKQSITPAHSCRAYDHSHGDRMITSKLASKAQTKMATIEASAAERIGRLPACLAIAVPCHAA